MPHPSVSHDGSGATWQHEDKSGLSHIDEASPRHPMPEPSSNNSRTFELPDSGKADESAAAHSSSPTVTYGHRPNPTWQPHSNAKPRLSFISYLAEEATPYEKEPQKDIVWGQTERDRVYQYLILVPYQLERLLQLGFVICVDTLLGAITLLPLRCLFSLMALFRDSRKSSPMGSTIRDQLGGGRIFDLLTLLILVAVTVSLKAIRPGFIYYWLKDITNEFLKMGVLSMAFDIFDRILSNFGVNVLEALSGTCTLYASRRIGLLPLACDAFVAYLLSLAHAFCLMCQALVVAVALNSRNGLIALLIASNLAETKSTVFKRFDVQRIRGLAFADAIERFQLVCILSFVVVEDMSSAGTWLPSWLIVKESLRILLSEVVIDILKHAVLGKFNEVRPGLHREIFKELCEALSDAQSHTYWRTISFHYLPAVGLVLRSVITLAMVTMEEATGSRYKVLCSRLALLVCIWLALTVIKIALGYAIKLYAISYCEVYNAGPFGRAHRGNLTVNVVKTPTRKDGHLNHTTGGASDFSEQNSKRKDE